MNNLATTAHPLKLGPRPTTKTKTKTKKKPSHRPPVKVVYISNPVRVTTSASRFRSLVQRLTGRDSEFPADPTAYEVGGDDEDDVTDSVSVGVLVGGDDVVVVETESDERVCEDNKSVEGSSTTTTTTSSYGDEFLMVGDFPDLGNEGLLWTLMST